MKKQISKSTKKSNLSNILPVTYGLLTIAITYFLIFLHNDIGGNGGILSLVTDFIAVIISFGMIMVLYIFALTKKDRTNYNVAFIIWLIIILGYFGLQML